MKAIFEKTKDILYNISDYVIMIAIILAIGLIITWRLEILFPENISNDSTISNTQSSGSKIIEKKEIKSVEKETSKSETSTLVKVDIPEGATTSNIGEILLEKNLISSVEEFEEKLKELSLEKLVDPGKYDIANDSSLEELINIIAKQN